MMKLTFDIENGLWKSSFCNFCRLVIKWTHFQPNKYSAGSILWAINFAPKIRSWFSMSYMLWKRLTCTVTKERLVIVSGGYGGQYYSDGSEFYYLDSTEILIDGQWIQGMLSIQYSYFYFHNFLTFSI